MHRPGSSGAPTKRTPPSCSSRSNSPNPLRFLFRPSGTPATSVLAYFCRLWMGGPRNPPSPKSPVSITNMNDKDPVENRLTETESSPMPRGLSPSAGGARLGGEREARQKISEPKIVLRIEAVESTTGQRCTTCGRNSSASLPQPPPPPSRHENEPQQIPARMLNEVVFVNGCSITEFVGVG